MLVSLCPVMMVVLVFTPYVTQGAVFTSQQTEDVVHFVTSLLQCRRIVGLTLAVVKGNETWTRGFGLADRETGRNVSTSDLFGIGSLTKAFTSALISIFFNDTSRYSWETPVVDILGKDFEFITDQLTKEVTLKDILTHRAGLDNTELPLLAGSTMTLAQFASRLRHRPIKKPFRDEFEYNNWMYALAGRVAEVMGGAPLENLLRSRLLQPLNMKSTVMMGKTVSVQAENFARPYVLLGEETVLSDPAIYNIGPQKAAGAIASSADDMVQWLLMHVNDGWSEKAGHVVNERRMREITEPHMGLPKQFRARLDLWKPQFPVTYASDGYGYGWFTASYRGYPVTWHAGGIHAYTSHIFFLPHLDVGFFVTNNGPGGGSNPFYINSHIFYYIADLLLGEEPWLNDSNACQFPEPWLSKTSADYNSPIYDNPNFVKPDRYAGHYEHPLFGNLHVVRNGSRALNVQYGYLEGRLFRGEEESVAMWEVLGKMAFVFIQGKNTFYLRLSFSRLSGQEGCVFQETVLTFPGTEDKLKFVRKVPGGENSRVGGKARG